LASNTQTSYYVYGGRDYLGYAFYSSLRTCTALSAVWLGANQVPYLHCAACEQLYFNTQKGGLRHPSTPPSIYASFPRTDKVAHLFAGKQVGKNYTTNGSLSVKLHHNFVKSVALLRSENAI
jgi:hypothetical protein